MSKKAEAKYQKEKTSMLGVKLIHSTDADIIAYLATLDNKSGYIKALIRADMEHKGGKAE